MKIITIFEEKLYSIKYDNKSKHAHEFERHLANWSNPKILAEIASKKNLSEKEAKKMHADVKRDLPTLIDKIRECAVSNTLFDFFEPYHKNPVEKPFQESKGKLKKGHKTVSCLRIYALKIGNNCFLITGCAIKTTRSNQDEEYTKKQAERMTEVRNYLKDNDITPDEFIYCLDII